MIGLLNDSYDEWQSSIALRAVCVPFVVKKKQYSMSFVKRIVSLDSIRLGKWAYNYSEFIVLPFNGKVRSTKHMLWSAWVSHAAVSI